MLSKVLRVTGRIGAYRVAPTSTSAFKLYRTASLISYPRRHFAYHDNVLDHYSNPRNVGSMDKKDPSVGTGLVGAPACGDVMKL